MADDARAGVQFTLNGGWVGKTVATLLAVWVVSMSTAVVQIMVTRYTSEDAAAMDARVAALERTIHEIHLQQSVNIERLNSIDKSVDRVATDAEWIRRRMEGTK